MWTTDDDTLLQYLEDLEGPNGILDFVPLTSPLYAAPVHLRPVADALWRAVNEGGVRACVSVPPRHGKTELLMHAVAWYLKRYPHKTVAYCSYEANFAASKSKLARIYAERAGVVLRKDSKSAREWRTPQGGGMLATGIGGPLTGHGVDLLIVDDPHKNRQEAESETIRESIHGWFTSTALSRLEPGGSVVVNMARWHDDDLIGRLMEDDQVAWEIINVPAIAPGTELALWPERWPIHMLEMKKRDVGDYDWASLYLGQPMPRGGYLFKEPVFYDYPEVEGARIAIACDPAASAKTSGDFSVICAVAARGLGVTQTVDVLDVWRGQVEIPYLVNKLKEKADYWGAPVFVESVGGFKGVPQMLRSIAPSLRVVELTPVTDKFTRALPVAAAWNDLRVRVPKSETWVDDFVKEIRKFTGKGDAHDDQVDALAHAYSAVDRQHPRADRGVMRVKGMA